MPHPAAVFVFEFLFHTSFIQRYGYVQGSFQLGRPPSGDLDRTLGGAPEPDAWVWALVQSTGIFFRKMLFFMKMSAKKMHFFYENA